MTQLIGISLVNWHLFAKADVRFAGNTAILGKNATGKSTLIDLVQTVMTGGSGTLYKFNRSAGEGGGRSERTLRSYCLGQTDQGVTLRPQAVTHLTLVFGGSGLVRPVTLGLCLEVAPNEEAARVVGRYVADGAAVGTDLLVEARDGGEMPVTWPMLRASLKQLCMEAGGELHEHPAQSSAAKTYIREYMRVLFTGRRAPDPERFIKAFIMALSFDDMRSVQDFVNNYLLARNDINIGDLRESILRYQQIQRDIAELERKLAALKPIVTTIERLEDTAKKEDMAVRMQRLAALLETLAEHRRLLRSRASQQAARLGLRDELESLDNDRRFANDELESIRAQVDSQGMESQRRLLASEMKDADRERDEVIRLLKERHVVSTRATELLGSRERLQSFGLGLGPLLGSLEAIRAAGDGLTPPAWPRDPQDMERLLTAATAQAGERLGKVLDKKDEITALRVEQEKAVNEAASRLAESQRGRVTLSRNVELLMEELRQAGMRPRTVCEVVEVVDETWRGAAEALLGRDRETILVDPEHAEQAVSTLRRERRRFVGCRVANTRRLASSSTTAAPGTLASVLSSDDHAAAAFVVHRLGSIRLAETQAQLMSEGRAVMRDGSYYDGLVVEVRHVDDMKIGRVAATLMTGVLEAVLSSGRAILDTHRQNEAFLKDVHARLVLLSTPVPEGQDLYRLAVALDDAEAKRRGIQDRLDRVSMMVDPKLREAQERLRSRLEELNALRDQNLRSTGVLESELREAESRLTAGANSLGSRHSLALQRKLFRERVPSLYMFSEISADYRLRMTGGKTHGRIGQELETSLKQLAEALHTLDASIRDAVADYCYAFSVQKPFGSESRIISEIKPWVEETIELLEGNDLVRYRRQADEAAERVTYLFRSSFVQELNSRFRALETEIADVREALRSKHLHGEVYSLHAVVRPEFRHIHDLARASETDERALSALFDPNAADHPYAIAVAEVERLLRDEQVDFTAYQDYRNYYVFELRMRDVETGHETTYDRRRGVASGAERQVPFYVIIGAALASIYHGNRRSPDQVRGLGLAVFDEAFSKMDGQNQRTMLDFYNEIGLQVLLAAPTEKRAVVYENLDSVIDVYRFGNHAEVEVARIKARTRTAMREANPEHLTDEVLLERLRSTDGASGSNQTGRDEETVQ